MELRNFLEAAAILGAVILAVLAAAALLDQTETAITVPHFLALQEGPEVLEMQAVAEAPELVGPQLTARVARVAMVQNSMVRTGVAVAEAVAVVPLDRLLDRVVQVETTAAAGAAAATAFLTGLGVLAFRG